MSGFIKIHRKMTDWEWYADNNTKAVFLHLLLTANWREGKRFMGYELKPGDVVVGIKRLSEDLNLTIQNVRTALTKLEATGEITRKSTNKFSIITIEKWGLYQCEDGATNKQLTNDQQSTNKQLTNDQQHLKNIRIQEEKNSLSPPSAEDVREYSASAGYKHVDANLFIAFYKSKNWMVGKNKMTNWKAAVDSWEITHRDQKVNSAQGEVSRHYDNWTENRPKETELSQEEREATARAREEAMAALKEI